MFSSGRALTFICAPLCLGAIIPVGGAHANSGSNATPPKLSIDYSSHKGNTIAITCALGNPSNSIKSITDTGGSVWTKRAGVAGAGVDSEIWTTAARGSSASTSFTITPSAPIPMSCALEEYSGVVALGQTATNSGNSGSGTVSVQTQDADNYVVAAISVGLYNGQSASMGKLRQNGGLTGNVSGNLVGNTLTDNTASAASSVTCSNTFGREPWAAAAIEFRSVAGGRKAGLLFPDGFPPADAILRPKLWRSSGAGLFLYSTMRTIWSEAIALAMLCAGFVVGSNVFGR
jgi:hypothetical protein